MTVGQLILGIIAITYTILYVIKAFKVVVFSWILKKRESNILEDYFTLLYILCLLTIVIYLTYDIKIL